MSEVKDDRILDEKFLTDPSINPQCLYISMKNCFPGEEYIYSVLTEDNKYLLQLDYDRLVSEKIREYFANKKSLLDADATYRDVTNHSGIKPNYDSIVWDWVGKCLGDDMSDNEYFATEDAQMPQPHAQYLCGHSKYELNLTDRLQSLLYFDGYGPLFKSLISKWFTEVPTLSTQERNSDINGTPSTDVEKNNTETHHQKDDSGEDKTGDDEKDKDSRKKTRIQLIETFVESPKEEPNPMKSTGSHSRGKGSGHSGRKPTPREKKQLGNWAEDAVLEALEQDQRYTVIHLWSEHLNPTDGDDSKGYDLEYKVEGEDLVRCLEIKYSDGSSIIVSNNEYAVSQQPENRDRFDIALVVNGQVKIWRNAFRDHSSYNMRSDSYTISFNMRDIGLGKDNEDEKL